MVLIRTAVLRLLVVLAVALGVAFGPAHAHAGGLGGPCLHRTMAVASPQEARPAHAGMAPAAHHHALKHEAAPIAADPGLPGAACADACVCAVCVTLPALAAATDDAPVARLRLGPAPVGPLPGVEPDRPDPPPRSAV